jgi:RNA-binding protein YhbY
MKAREGAAALARASGSAVAGVLGHTALLYRPREEDPEIRLPGAVDDED